MASPFIAELLDLCAETIVWEAARARDAYGKISSFAAPVTFPGRRVYENKRQATQSQHGIRGEGVEVVSTSTIWIMGTPTVAQDDRVYVQGDNISRGAPTVLNVERFPDETGEIFIKVYLGSALG